MKEAKLNTFKLGSSDLHVPKLCLGTMTWGQQNTEQEAHEQLDYAVDERGLFFLDTAEMYPIPPDTDKQGRTETYIGNWLKKRGKRDELVLATKVAIGKFMQTRDVGDPPHYDRKSIREAVEGSLQRLQTDYIDLYQVHFPERTTNAFGVRNYKHNADEKPTPIEETLDALQELIQEGKVRYIGVSNETGWGVSEYLRLAREKNLPKIVSIQNQYSLTNRRFEMELAEFSMRENIGLLAYSPLNMGVLTGKYLDGKKPKGARFTLYGRNVERYNPVRADEAVRRYVGIAKDAGIDPAQLALAYAMDREFMASVILGATTLDQLKTDIDSLDVTLSEDVLTAIEKVFHDYPNITV